MLSANHPIDGPSPRHLEISVRVDGDSVALVALKGELDFSSYDVATERLAAVEDAAPSEIVIDLSSLTFIDSSGIRLISLLERRSTARGAAFRLRGVSGPVRRVLDLTGVSARVQID